MIRREEKAWNNHYLHDEHLHGRRQTRATDTARENKKTDTASHWFVKNKIKCENKFKCNACKGGAVNWLLSPTLSHRAFVHYKVTCAYWCNDGKGCQITQTTLCKANKDSNIVWLLQLSCASLHVCSKQCGHITLLSHTAESQIYGYYYFTFNLI